MLLVILCARSTNLFCQAPNHGLGFCQENIVLKRIFDGYGLCWPVRDEFTFVDAPREFMEAQPIAPEFPFERGTIQSPQIPDSMYSQFRELLSCDFPQLKNIVRAEPDPSLFFVPAGFTITDGPQPIQYRSNQ